MRKTIRRNYRSVPCPRRHTRRSVGDDIVTSRSTWPPDVRLWTCRGGRRADTVYTSSDGGGGGGGAAVIGNHTAAGPTSTSPLLHTPRPTALVGQPNGTGVGGGGGVVVVGSGDEGLFDGGYWWWASLAVFLVLATAAGNILVCLAITWERRLQNVTNYFLMSLAVTDLMIAVLVMPVGILTLVKGTWKIFIVLTTF